MTSQNHAHDFGGHLRQARERKGVTLRTIADVTRISMAALEGLERNDISRLPGGIFSRAFVRSYAHEVGLDADAAVDEFVRCFPDDSVVDGHPSAVQARVLEDVNAIRRSSSRPVLSIVAALIVSLLVYAGVRRWWPAAGPSAGESAPRALAAAADTGRPADPVSHLRILLVARSGCLVSYSTGGGLAVEVSLPAGSQRTIEVADTLDLTVSDGGALDVSINGAATVPLGPAGVPATRRITLDNYHTLLAAS